ncbi:hypothetical protein [Curvivirga sp.]|uniref:hypothetical protein n=1 Tax=Curvivirga sp. TaxID=2856848 RepID=UPI003B5AB7FA
MFAPGKELMATMEVMIAKEIARLLQEADCCVFVVYDPSNPEMDPLDYICHERKSGQPINMNVALDYEGIGVWYLVFRNEDVFNAKKVLLHIEDGQFIHGQMGDFKGYWQDFPRYILEDRWVQEQLAKTVSNDSFHVHEVEEHREAFSHSIDEFVHENDEGILKDEVNPVNAATVSQNNWFEPPEEKEPELSPFAQDDQESVDLIDLYDQDGIQVDGFPDQPFGRFSRN